jgi:hypothetical protein
VPASTQWVNFSNGKQIMPDGHFLTSEMSLHCSQQAVITERDAGSARFGCDFLCGNGQRQVVGIKPLTSD